MPIEIIAAVVGFFLSLVLWLLKSKDTKQAGQLEEVERSVQTLFKKHDEDAKDLQELRVQIAGNHYQKHELDARFDRLETSFREGFKAIGEKVDRLGEILLGHVKND